MALPFRSLIRQLPSRHDLIASLAKKSRHTYEEVMVKIRTHPVQGNEEGRITAESLVRDGILVHYRETGQYVVSSGLRDFFRWGERTRTLTSSGLSDIFIKGLREVCNKLEEHLSGGEGDYFRIAQDVDALEKVMQEIRNAIEGNTDEIFRIAEELKKNPPRRAKDRLARVIKVWEDQIEPLEEVFGSSREVETEIRRIERLYHYAESENAPFEIVMDLRQAVAFANHATRCAHLAHGAAVKELSPIVHNARRDSALSEAAARFAEGARKKADWWVNGPWESAVGTAGFRKYGDEEFGNLIYSDAQLEMSFLQDRASCARYKAPRILPRKPVSEKDPYAKYNYFTVQKLLKFLDEAGGTDDLGLFLASRFPDIGNRHFARLYMDVIGERLGEVSKTSRSVVILGDTRITCAKIAIQPKVCV